MEASDYISTLFDQSRGTVEMVLFMSAGRKCSVYIYIHYNFIYEILFLVFCSLYLPLAKAL